MDLLAIVLATLLGLAASLVIARVSGARGALALLAAMAASSVGAALLRARQVPPPPSSPPEVARGDVVGSGACRACHPGEYASWSRTFHRTMTQRASSRTVLADVDGVSLEDVAGRVTFTRRGDDVWVTLPDPDEDSPAPSVTRPLLLTTGAHRQQAYWIAGRRSGEFRMLPFVWLVPERRWLRRRDAFLQPEDAPQHRVRWNSNCIQCHATFGRPRHVLGADRFDTEVGELGIACEACHGPGGEHVRARRDPRARYALHASGEADRTIVNPARLPADRASMVCGQCHAYAYPKDEDDWWTNGYANTFHAGDDLSASRALLTRTALVEGRGPTLDTALASVFWTDGAVRVGGREYNGMLESACYLRGEGARRIGCLSCHAMHASEPSGQLRRDAPGDEPCLRCHEEMRPRVADHTHHAPGSPGSACVACHMPKTSYALLRAIRSHRVDSPRVGARDRPSACALCHLDRPRAWIEGKLTTLWGQSLAEVDGDVVASAVRALLAGDAATRALVADAMGDEAALLASGRGWQGPLLAVLAEDRYAAIRFVAARSKDRAGGIASPPPDRRAALLRRPDGTLDEDALRALLAQRDERAVTIAE
jgi:predicted CXXCH cytochrome family protein